MGRYYTVNPKRDKDGLTAKQKKFADKALQVGPTNAARELHPGAINPSAIAAKKMTPAVSSYMSEVLTEKGGSREACAKNIADKIGCDDNAASLKATEIALKIHGELKESSTTINFLTPQSFDIFIAKLNDHPS